MIDAIKDRWARLSVRERRTLLLGAAITLPLLGWALIGHPLQAAHEAARTAHSETAAQLAEVRALAAQLARRGGQEQRAASTASPLGAIEMAAREQRLLEPLKRREAEGANGARLVLEEAPADALMRLLEQLEHQHGLRVVQGQIEPAGPGRVNASLTVQRGGGR
jgi:type II secretory pathway component PulM